MKETGSVRVHLFRTLSLPLFKGQPPSSYLEVGWSPQPSTFPELSRTSRYVPASASPLYDQVVVLDLPAHSQWGALSFSLFTQKQTLLDSFWIKLGPATSICSQFYEVLGSNGHTRLYFLVTLIPALEQSFAGQNVRIRLKRFSMFPVPYAPGYYMGLSFSSLGELSPAFIDLSGKGGKVAVFEMRADCSMILGQCVKLPEMQEQGGLQLTVGQQVLQRKIGAFLLAWHIQAGTRLIWSLVGKIDGLQAELLDSLYHQTAFTKQLQMAPSTPFSSTRTQLRLQCLAEDAQSPDQYQQEEKPKGVRGEWLLMSKQLSQKVELNHRIGAEILLIEQEIEAIGRQLGPLRRSAEQVQAQRILSQSRKVRFQLAASKSKRDVPSSIAKMDGEEVRARLAEAVILLHTMRKENDRIAQHLSKESLLQQADPHPLRDLARSNQARIALLQDRLQKKSRYAALLKEQQRLLVKAERDFEQHLLKEDLMKEIEQRSAELAAADSQQRQSQKLGQAMLQRRNLQQILRSLQQVEFKPHPLDEQVRRLQQQLRELSRQQFLELDKMGQHA